MQSEPNDIIISISVKDPIMPDSKIEHILKVRRQILDMPNVEESLGAIVNSAIYQILSKERLLIKEYNRSVDKNGKQNKNTRNP